MLLQRIPYLFVYLVSLILSVGVFYYAWRNRSSPGIRLFAWSILLEITWLIGYFAEVNSTSMEAKIFWDNVQYIGTLFAPVLLTGFAVEFTELRTDARRITLSLSIIPILFLLTVFSYQFPELIRIDPRVEPGTPFNELDYEFGRLAAWINNYVYVVAAAYLVILSTGLFRRISVARPQVAVVLIGTLVPIVGSSVAYELGWKFANQGDISPLTFAVSNAIIAFGIFRFRLFNVIPIARQALFDTIDDILIVLDNNDHVVDANPSALDAFGWKADQLKDVSLTKALPDLYAQFKDVNNIRTMIALPDGTHYDLKITPIFDRSGSLFGRLIDAHDITAQKKIEQDLQRTNEQNRKRAAQFQVIAQVASSITSVQELRNTLNQIADTLSTQLGHYHVGIFLVDSTFQFALLQAANSEGGQEMLAQSYRLRIGSTGIVSAVLTTNKPQIALDVDKSRAFYANPFLPQTRSEVALPIRIRGELIGVLDIQSLKENAFATDDLEVFEILASQVGIAIQNARLYEQNVASLRDVEEAYRRTSSSAWSNLLRQLDIKGYAYDGVSSHPVAEAQSNPRAAALSVPVTVRGNVIGNLRLSPMDPNRTWTDDEIAILNAVAERAALALEGARLLEDAQKRASRESFLSEMAAKLSTSFQLDSILRDTVEELGQTLSGSTVSFQLVKPSMNGADEKSNGSARNGKSE